MTTPCIICVAITGSLPTKDNNPAVPITISEQIESTHEAFEAGATIAHCHVRDDDGRPTSDPDRFARLKEGLETHCPGLIVQLSTGGRSGAGQARIGLALAPGKALARPIDGDARRMDEAKALGQKRRPEEMGEGAHHVEADDRLAAKRAQIGRERCDPLRRVLHRPVEQRPARLVDGAGPVDRLGDIHSHRNPHGDPPSLPRTRMPRLAGIALQSHQGHRAISGRSRAAMRAAQPSEPSGTASMTAIPASPGPKQLPTDRGALKRGKAA
ncbi:3-keto-5-aminohexanoate cleavage enzyme [Paracoccus sediminis]|uniref:3-keto-5-aminohexanoate cleavage enzyme n=1 Tax=Paracoccus sediminis TaxID=1214787 RepID=A0A238YI48_9RHOB|nr:3-keto-5-aminohexanoate cleavage protein [Paracoccus sediminis]SNR70273.1 3-keto-5-aminohexanoate cleavage enzyme [Paracoccus sediminis]